MAAPAHGAAAAPGDTTPGGRRLRAWNGAPSGLGVGGISGRLLAIVAALPLFLAALILAVPVQVADHLEIGVTFSPRYAAGLGLDSQTVYTRMLRELPLQEIRLPIYWDEVEAVEGAYNFSGVDWYVREAALHGRTVIPVLGYKAPRWPECHPPAWIAGRTLAEKRAAILRLLRAEVEHLRHHPNVESWQIENEPYFPFGECDGFAVLDESFVAEEVALVRQRDDRPVLITDSGELSLWIGAMRSGDRFGSSLYRSIWFEHVGLISYPIPPSLYAVKDRLARLATGATGERIVVELQAEPWFMTGRTITDVPLDRQLAMFPPSMLREHVGYAQRTGVSTVHLWGVEWWYWMHRQGHPDYLLAVQQLLAELGQPATDRPGHQLP